MAKNVDTRDYTFRQPVADFAATATTVSVDLEGSHAVSAGRVNPFTGSVENLQSANATSAFSVMPGLGPTDEDIVARALEHVQIVAPALGFDPTHAVEFVPDPHVKKTSTGERVVNLQQQYRGIPVFQMERAVLFDQSGAIQSVTGTSVSLPPSLGTLPTVPVENAALAAAKFIATPSSTQDAWTKEVINEPTVDVSNYQPRVLAKIPLASQPLVLDQGPFAEAIPAHLVFFYQGQATRLGWQLLISTPDFEAQYLIIIAADAQSEDEMKDPPVLYCRETSSHMSALPPRIRGNVWTHNPGMNQTRQVVDFPRPLADYPISPLPPNLPETFPFGWIESGGSQAIGNNAIALLGDSANSVSGVSANGTVTFNPTQEQGDEQKVVNIFYFCNFMHDFFFMLGFDEPAGNLQERNFSGLGRGGDPVVARAHPGRVTGTANMLTRADGVRAQMNMGLVVASNRHTAFDSDVVFHEYTHGVSKRLVGGMLDAQGLNEPQSASMGEGWSDYFALTIQNHGLQQERTVLGDWVLNRAGGIRLHPYDDNYPATYGNVGTPPYVEVHNIGEIWCAALMKMNRDLGRAFGDRRRGHLLGWQIVADGFKKTPANPSFLAARDAILQSLDAQRKVGKLSPDDFRLALRAVWGAFARFGMGPNARSVGASLVGIVEDRNLPPGL
jgi:extracellular elastinolytic metalloproteinase